MKGKKTIVLWVVLTVIVLSFLSGVPQYLYKYVSLYNTFQSIVTLSKSNDTASLYEYIIPIDKEKISLQDYVTQYTWKKPPTSIDYTLNSITIDGDTGIVDRTVVECFSASCQGTDRFEDTSRKEYQYINGKWYIPLDNQILCSRKTPYPIPPEFSRAISLSIQRFSNSSATNEQEVGKLFNKISNCLDVTYANTDAQLNGAEGLFAFNKDSNPDDLQIFVSPKYAASDDIMTAVLLTHEMTHATLHAIGTDKEISCYDNETNAFTNQIAFLYTLNPGETDSLKQRINNQSSDDVNNLVFLINTVSQYQGNNLQEKVKQFVMAQPFYQQECGGSPNPSN